MQLNGSVDKEGTQQRATELARQVEGVRRVVNSSRCRFRAYRRKKKRKRTRLSMATHAALKTPKAYRKRDFDLKGLVSCL